MSNFKYKSLDEIMNNIKTLSDFGFFDFIILFIIIGLILFIVLYGIPIIKIYILNKEKEKESKKKKKLLNHIKAQREIEIEIENEINEMTKNESTP